MESTRTFRVFVSSTFSDFKEERNALQKYVFPRLRELCIQHGAQFQAVDLRWGVSDEASFDQQTMRICLEEVRRCKATTQRPNFIVLLGDRYGWCPLPYEIPVHEFEEILNHVPKNTAKYQRRRSLIEYWYRRDDNAVPPVYCLRTREGKHQRGKRWSWTEHLLRIILSEAIRSMSLTPEQRLKYFASATEQEIHEGVFQVANAQEHVFCFFRSIPDLVDGIRSHPEDGGLPDAERKRAQSFVDLDKTRDIDIQAYTRLENLKKRLGNKLLGHIYKYSAGWIGKEGEEITKQHIGQLPETLEECRSILNEEFPPQSLCADVWRSLAQTILEEIRQRKPIEEDTAHKDFGQEHCRSFVGRETVLSTIDDYLKSADRHPLVVFGASGVGKTALMAQATQNAHRDQSKPQAAIVSRFVGATSTSSNVRDMLNELCQQISAFYETGKSTIPDNDNYDDLVHEFPKQLALAHKEKPLIVFLDALDQLSGSEQARSFPWLPSQLPEHVHLVASIMWDRDNESSITPETEFPQAKCIELMPMIPEEGHDLLSEWLSNAGRTLQSDQLEEVLSHFEKTGLPLYLKLAFEEARLWKSYSPRVVLGDNIPNIIQKNLFARLERPTNHGSLLVSRSLGYIAASRYGLSEGEILDILAKDEQYWPALQQVSEKHDHILTSRQIPFSIWSRLYADLHPYLKHNSVENQSLLAFYHQQLAEAAEMCYLQEKEKQRRHRELAAYFHQKADPTEDATWCGNYPRGLSELPYHLSQGNHWGLLEATLCDLGFIEAKLNKKMLLGLLDDYRFLETKFDKSLSSLPTNIDNILEYGRFVREQSSVLQEHSELTFQQAANYSTNGAIQQNALDRWESGRERRPWLQLVRPEVGSLAPYVSFRTVNKPVSATISQNGERIGLCDGEVAVYDIQSAHKILHLPFDANARYTAIALSHDGSILACAEYSDSGPKPITLWNVSRQRKIGQFIGHHGQVLTLRFSPQADRLVMGGALPKDGEIALWKVADCSLVWHETKTITGAIARRVVFSPDGSTLVVAQGDGVCSFWNVATGEWEESIAAHQGTINGLCISRSGDRIATSGKDGLCQVWTFPLKPGTRRQGFVEFLRGKKKPQILVSRRITQTAIVFLNGSHLVFGDNDGYAYIWDTSSREQLHTLFSGEGRVVELEVSSDDGFLLALSEDDRTCRLYKTRNQALFTADHRGQTCFLRFLSGSTELVVGRKGEKVKTLKLGFDASSQDAMREIAQVENVVSMAASRNGRFILTVNRSREWLLWDAEYSTYASGIFKTPIDTDILTSVANNGQWICIFTREQVERISTETQRNYEHRVPMIPHAIWQQDDGSIRVVGIAMRFKHRIPEEILALDLNLDGSIYYWGVYEADSPRNSRGFSFSDIDTFVRCTSTPDEQGVIDIWDVRGEQKAKWGYSEAVNTCDFTPNGELLLLYSPSKSMVSVVDATSPATSPRWSYPVFDAVTSATIQADGDLIAVGYKQGGLDILRRIQSQDGEE